MAGDILKRMTQPVNKTDFLKCSHLGKKTSVLPLVNNLSCCDIKLKYAGQAD